MQIVVDSRTNALQFKGVIDKGIFSEADPDMELYKIVDGDDTFYVVTNGFKDYEVNSLPDDLDPQALDKYCYSQAKGFYKNKNYTEPEQPVEEKVSDLQGYTADLLYQVCLLQLGTSDDDVSINKNK